jgi:transposase
MKGGQYSKLCAICDGKRLPRIMLLSEGQMSDCKGVTLMIDAFPKAKALLADQGYDAGLFRHSKAERGITVGIPSKLNCKVPIPHDTRSNPRATASKNVRQTHRRAAPQCLCYDRCFQTSMCAICIAATVIL